MVRGKEEKKGKGFPQTDKIAKALKNPYLRTCNTGILGKKERHKNHLNPSTFWDVDLNLLDASKDMDFIIVRVLERGADVEIQYIETAYSQQEITTALESTKGVSKKTLNFYKSISL